MCSACVCVICVSQNVHHNLTLYVYLLLLPFFFFSIFSHFHVGSMCLMRRLHLARSCASSPDNSLSDKSFLTFGHTEPPIRSSSSSILIVFHASSPHLILIYNVSMYNIIWHHMLLLSASEGFKFCVNVVVVPALELSCFAALTYMKACFRSFGLIQRT